MPTATQAFLPLPGTAWPHLQDWHLGTHYVQFPSRSQVIQVLEFLFSFTVGWHNFNQWHQLFFSQFKIFYYITFMAPSRVNRKHYSKFLSYMLKNMHFSIFHLIIPPLTTTILTQFLSARHCSKHGTWMTWFGLCSTTMNGKYYILFNIWGKWDPEWLSNWLKIFKVDQI